MHLYLTAIAIQEEKIRQAQKTSQVTKRSPIRSSWAEWSLRLLHRRDSSITDGSAALGARSGTDEGLARVVRNPDRSPRMPRVQPSDGPWSEPPPGTTAVAVVIHVPDGAKVACADLG